MYIYICTYIITLFVGTQWTCPAGSCVVLCRHTLDADRHRTILFESCLACILVSQASDTVVTAALRMGDAAAGKAAASDASAIDIAVAAGGQAGTWQGAYDAAAANSCAGDAAAWVAPAAV